MKYQYMQFLIKHDDNVLGGQKVIVYFINTLTNAKGAQPMNGQIKELGLYVIFCTKLLHTDNSLIFTDAREGKLPIV